MTNEEKYKEFLKSKLSFWEYKDENYPKYFINRLTRFIQEQGYDYNDFQCMMNNNFDHEFTPEGLLNLLVVKSDLGNHVENYNDAVGDKFTGIFYLFLNEIPVLHNDTMQGLTSSYKIYEVEAEQEFKWKVLKGEIE